MVDVHKKMRQGKKRVMTKTRIDEISAVDFPAMEGARAVLVKRREGVPIEGHVDDAAAKCGGDDAPITLITSEEDGHTHLIRIYGGMRGGETSYSRAPNTVEETDHTHPWALNADGEITIGANDGHTHSADQRALVQSILSLMKRSARTGEPVPDLDPALLDLVKVQSNDTEDPMTTPPTKTEPTEVEKKLRADLDAATKLAELNDAEKAIYRKLATPEERSAFLNKSATERKALVDAEVAKASAADPVVYTATDGRVFKRSDDPRWVAEVQRADAEAKKRIDAEAAATQERCEKRADTELGKFPGDLKVRSAIVKALEGIPDEVVRKAAFESMRAGNTALSGVFQKRGIVGGAPVADKASAVQKLDELAKAHAAEKGVNYFDAYDVVKNAHPELYQTAVAGPA